MIHHTAPPVPFPVDRLYGDLLKANINVKPDGTVWLLAAKACNFSSGSGSSVVLDEVRRAQPPTKNAWERHLSDDVNGNPWFFNFENDHPGDGSPLPSVQLDAIVGATRVVLDHYGLSPGNVISHAEWTARKRDPYWNGSLRAIEEIRSLLEDPMALTANEEKFVKDLFSRMKEQYPGDDVPTAAGISTYLIPDVRKNLVTMDELQSMLSSSSTIDQFARNLAKANEAKLARIKDAI